MEHTKGPWKLENDGYVNILTGPKGEHIAEIELCFENEELDPGSLNQFSTETGTANANLIVASPELLDAAKTALQLLEDMDHDDIVCAIELRAAINKAEGR